MEAFPVRSVIDVGCGIGAWLKEFSENGVHRAVGLDGVYVARDQLVIDAGNFVGHDLERPLPPLGTFDLATSLEVAEHLTPARADSFISDLCGLADVVLFSAAIPFQGGDNHINEQWQSFWAAKFAGHGFELFDVLRSRIWEETNVCFWYKQNILFYVKRGSAAARRFNERFSAGTNSVDLVHPTLYRAKTTRMYSRGLYRSISNPFRPKIARSLAALNARLPATPANPRGNSPTPETVDR
jgi:SAM-dependent methyltransferase